MLAMSCELLDVAIDGCTTGEFDAMVTAPIQKSVIIDAGVRFSGHTEYLAERTGRRNRSCCWRRAICASRSRRRTCR